MMIVIGLGKEIVRNNMNIWVNGCFDILHTGHLDLLWYAKLYGVEGLGYHEAMKANTLFVGTDSDDRVKMLKGDDRPINSAHDRVTMLSNLKMVDSVVIFHDDEELRYFIREFDIDYMVIGDQYKDKLVIGAECAKQGVVYYPTDERSSTGIIEKIEFGVFLKMHEEFHRNDDKISMALNNYAVKRILKLKE